MKAKEAGAGHQVWKILSRFTHPRWAAWAIAAAALSAVGGVYLRQDLKTGDLDPGAPELRPYARYNKDNAYLNAHYSAGSDIFIVMVKTPPAGTAPIPSSWPPISLSGGCHSSKAYRMSSAMWIT